MSHRIIISSTKIAAESDATANAGDAAEITITVSYSPAHNESDRVVLNRVGRLMKLMHQMDDAIDENQSNDTEGGSQAR